MGLSLFEGADDEGGEPGGPVGVGLAECRKGVVGTPEAGNE